jgi:hypothetical protein
MKSKVSLQSKAIAHYVLPERTISNTDLSCMFVSLDYIVTLNPLKVIVAHFGAQTEVS